jgi:hypothetical protein
MSISPSSWRHELVLAPAVAHDPPAVERAGLDLVLGDGKALGAPDLPARQYPLRLGS